MHLMEFHQPKGVVAFETCKLACNTFLNNKHVLFDLLPSLPQKLRARPTESLFGEPPFRVPSASFATLIMREHFMAISFLRNYLNIFRCIAGVSFLRVPQFLAVLKGHQHENHSFGWSPKKETSLHTFEEEPWFRSPTVGSQPEDWLQRGGFGLLTVTWFEVPGQGTGLDLAS